MAWVTDDYGWVCGWLVNSHVLVLGFGVFSWVQLSASYWTNFSKWILRPDWWLLTWCLTCVIQDLIYWWVSAGSRWKWYLQWAWGCRCRLKSIIIYFEFAFRRLGRSLVGLGVSGVLLEDGWLERVLQDFATSSFNAHLREQVLTEWSIHHFWRVHFALGGLSLQDLHLVDLSLADGR